MTNAQLWQLYPSLPYRTAFDHCAAKIHPLSGPIAILTSSAFYARELLKRIQEDVLTYLMAYGWELEEAEIGLEAPWNQISFLKGNEEMDPVETVLWAEPQETDLSKIHAFLKSNLAGGRLLIITSNPLSFNLPERRYSQLAPAKQPMGA